MMRRMAEEDQIDAYGLDDSTLDGVELAGLLGRLVGVGHGVGREEKRVRERRGSKVRLDRMRMRGRELIWTRATLTSRVSTPM
jgi:hypothetical protein